MSLPDPPGVAVRRVETAREMLDAVTAAMPADILVAAAAVADWRAAEPSAAKIKKGRDGAPALRLVENPDILATVARGSVRPRLVVGFAAETEDLLDHAARKLDAKGCDLIVANRVGPGSDVMGGPDNEVHLLTRAGVDSWPKMSKDAVAERLVARLAAMLEAPSP